MHEHTIPSTRRSQHGGTLQNGSPINLADCSPQNTALRTARWLEDVNAAQASNLILWLSPLDIAARYAPLGTDYNDNAAA